MIGKMNKWVKKCKNGISKLSHDNRGVAAIEFALISPLLITLYLGTMEISAAIQMNKKVGRAASTVGDLTSRLPNTTSKTAIDNILRIGRAGTQPYDKTFPVVTVSEIYIDNTGATTVEWSRQLETGGTVTVPFSKGSVDTTLPANLKINGTWVIRATMKMEYRTLTSWTIKKEGANTFGKVNMAETYYLRPRVIGGKIDCTDCT